MVGSRKFFVYTDNRGEDWGIQLDESNTEAVNGAIQDFPDAAPTVYTMPKNLKPRMLVYANADRTIVRRVVALTQAIYNGAPTSLGSVDFGAPAGTLRLFDVVPEDLKAPFGLDTAQQDGDAT